ncbi:MAG: hypothetical protein COB12_12690 [Flavobacterium sp.]|nr:MAG: hypothetical protein COB12_12690 [Flavobacterium sp.]
MATQEGTITATGAKLPITLGGNLSLSLRDFGTATIVLERAVNGKDFSAVEVFTTNIEKVGDGNGDLYRLNCTAFTLGTIAYTLKG